MSTFGSTDHLNGKRITESLRYDKARDKGRRVNADLRHHVFGGVEAAKRTDPG